MLFQFMLPLWITYIYKLILFYFIDEHTLSFKLK